MLLIWFGSFWLVVSEGKSKGIFPAMGQRLHILSYDQQKTPITIPKFSYCWWLKPGEAIQLGWSHYLPSLKLTKTPLKIGLPNRKVVFQPCIFRGYVSSREGTFLVLYVIWLLSWLIGFIFTALVYKWSVIFHLFIETTTLLLVHQHDRLGLPLQSAQVPKPSQWHHMALANQPTRQITTWWNTPNHFPT